MNFPNKNQEIQAIIFDFGGVLLDIDYQKTYDAMSKLLGMDFVPAKLPKETLQALNDFETGHINVETFIWNIQRLAKKEMPIGQDIIKAWNAMLIGWDVSKFEFLTQLRQKYKLFLLSNTNELHIDWVRKDLKKNHHIIDFEDRFFDKVYYSHIIQKRKPNKDIFEFVLDDADLDPKHTIFIDDLAENIETGRCVGLQTYHHNPNDDLASKLSRLLTL
jgi:putative hydrolase of the HAD superfamily